MWPILTTARFTLFAIGAWYMIAVLFGAPLFTDFERTLTFSIVLSSLTAFPIGITFTDYDQLELLLFENSAETCGQLIAHRLALLSVVGSWFGAFVIPLDWDRWWQVWPISCVIGAGIGAFIGLSIALIELNCIKHKRVFRRKKGYKSV